MRTSLSRLLTSTAVATMATLLPALPAFAADTGDGAAPGLVAVAEQVTAAAFDESNLPADPVGDVKMVIVSDDGDERRVTVAPARDLDHAADKVLEAMETRTVVSVGVDVPVRALTTVDSVDQWQMDPATSSYQAAWSTATGTGVTVAVVDSGVVRNHPDLPSSRVLTGAEFAGGTGNQTASNGNRDVLGHGTFVAGVIAATKGNAQGIAGVAPGATILPVRVLGDSGSGSSADVTAGIYYAVAQGAKVINLSLGSANEFTPMRDAIDYAVAHGVVVVAASGNAGPNTVNYPAAYTNAIAVAALAAGNALASYSSYSSSSPYVDIAAPGSNITSTNTTSAANYATNPYTSGNGTSYAAPHVAAVAALMLEALPSLTPAQVRAAMESSATDLGTAGNDPQTGAGAIRPAEAIVAADGSSAGDGPVAFVATTPLRVSSVKPKKDTSVAITIAGAQGIPTDARSVLVKVTVAKGKAGTVTLTPYGDPDGAQTFTNGPAGVAQTVTLPLGIGGKVLLSMQVPATVTLDVQGWSVPTTDADAGKVVDVTSARLLDTRTGTGVSLATPGDTKSCTDFTRWDAANAWYWTYKAAYGDVADLDEDDDGIVCSALWAKLKTKPATTQPADLFKTNGKVVVKSTVDVKVLDAGGVPATGVAAVKLTVTAIEPKNKGTLQVLPAGGTVGAYANLTFATKTTTTETVVVPAGTDGKVTLYTKAATHLTVDVVAYVTTA